MKAGTEGNEGDNRLKLTPGFYAVHAFVNHNFYRPAHLWMPVEVKTEATRSRELNDETFGARGDRNMTEIVHDFETGLLDDAPGAATSSTWTARATLPHRSKRCAAALT